MVRSRRRPEWHVIVPQIFSQCINEATCSSKTRAEYTDLILNSYIQAHPEENKQRAKWSHLQMNVGKVWQRLMGQCYDVFDLRSNDPSGLDLLSYKRKFVVELKNRYNTDNASARRANLTKLVDFKLANPDYEVIYAYVNESTTMRTLEGTDTYLNVEDVQIRHLTGGKLLAYIFGEDWKLIVSLLENEAINCL